MVPQPRHIFRWLAFNIDRTTTHSTEAYFPAAKFRVFRTDFFKKTPNLAHASVAQPHENVERIFHRCLKSLRRLFHLLAAEMLSMLKKSATLIASAPCQDVVDAQKLCVANSISPRRGVVDDYLQRRQFRKR